MTVHYFTIGSFDVEFSNVLAILFAYEQFISLLPVLFPHANSDHV